MSETFAAFPSDFLDKYQFIIVDNNFSFEDKKLDESLSDSYSSLKVFFEDNFLGYIQETSHNHWQAISTPSSLEIKNIEIYGFASRAYAVYYLNLIAALENQYLLEKLSRFPWEMELVELPDDELDGDDVY